MSFSFFLLSSDAGVGASLRQHIGKSSQILIGLLVSQVLCSVLVMTLVLGTPFFTLFPSALILCTGAGLQFGVAVLALVTYSVNEEHRNKMCGKEKSYFFFFLCWDTVGMLINSVCGMYAGDQLKGPTMWFAAFFAFALFISYGCTNIMYYLALRGDLPDVVVGLTAPHEKMAATTATTSEQKQEPPNLDSYKKNNPLRHHARGANNAKIEKGDIVL